MKEVKEKKKETKEKKKMSKKKKVIITISIIFGVILLAVIAFLIWWFNRKFDITFKYNNGKPNNEFRLLKVSDPDRNVCKKFLNDNDYKSQEISEIDWGTVREDSVADLIAKSDTNLALYYLYVATPATNDETSNAFYSGSFILATLEGGVNILSKGNYCKPPGEKDEEENFNYCAINKFNFAVQGNGG